MSMSIISANIAVGVANTDRTTIAQIGNSIIFALQFGDRVHAVIAPWA